MNRCEDLKKWLVNIQGKESTKIPASILTLVKETANRSQDLTRDDIRVVLRDTGNAKYYEHIPSIMFEITGIPPTPQFGEETERELIQMYLESVKAFYGLYGNKRSFLSNSYVVRKLLQIMGKDDLLGSFATPRSIEKMRCQEEDWMQVCHELDWPFIS
jgi:hypothetical protein